MSTPDEIIRQRLEDGLDVTGTVEAGVYGDQADAAAPPLELDLSKAEAVNPDVEALEARIAAQQASIAAAATPVLVDPVPEPNPPPSISASVPSDLREAIDYLHARLTRLETRD